MCWHHTLFTGRLNTSVVVSPANIDSVNIIKHYPFTAAALALPVCSSFTLFSCQFPPYSCSFLQRKAVSKTQLIFFYRPVVWKSQEASTPINLTHHGCSLIKHRLRRCIKIVFCNSICRGNARPRHVDFIKSNLLVSDV